jgi:hypothetical protein
MILHACTPQDHPDPINLTELCMARVLVLTAKITHNNFHSVDLM